MTHTLKSRQRNDTELAKNERIWLEPAGAPDRCWCEDNQWGEDGVEYVRVSALPAPDDGLVERLRYRVENPSAWDSFDQGGSDLCREAATALQSKDEQIEHWRQNSIDTWSAMVAMRNAINEHVPMPSIEGDLLKGPENSVFCAAVASAVIEKIGLTRREYDSACNEAAACYAKQCAAEYRAEAAEQQVQKLTAENERLNASFNLIDALDPEEHIYGVSHDACRGLIIRMGQIARSALETQEGGE